MSRYLRIFLLFSALVCGFAVLAPRAWNRTPDPSPVAVSGTVLDAASLAPLTGVEVSWKTRKVSTGQSGRYRIDLPPGIRVISLSAPNRQPVRKIVVVRTAATPVTLDALLPEGSQLPPKVLALDRGSFPAPQGKTFDSDVAADSTISLADRYGNADELLTLKTGKSRLRAPVWLDNGSLAFAKEGLAHDPDQLKRLGVFRLQRGQDSVEQLAAVPGIVSLGKSPRTGALAIATGKELLVLDSSSTPGTARRIFNLDANRGFLLSVAWGPDDRIYFSVEDTLPLDDRHYLSRSRIGSIRPDGTDVNPDWASEKQYSFRYPMPDDQGGILFGRFALNGSAQALWRRDIRTGEARLVAEPGLRAVELDAPSGRLYYIYDKDLHLRNLKTGADWTIVNSVVEADYLRTASGR